MMASATSFDEANVGFQTGIINGPVHTAFGEQPDTPSAVLPFARDADFVEREAILDRICERCAVPDSRTALVGLGGVGKSQIAIEYAYRTRDRSPERWVFWVYASNAARFEQSYRDIADRVKIAGRGDPQANIFKLVHDWLCNSGAWWLLILDNVDDTRFLLDYQAADSKTASRPLCEYLPVCERGSTLVTTRSKEAASRLAEKRHIINVEPMDEAHALVLFEKKLGAQQNSNDVAELAAALEYMPLAIVQAAAYISQRGPKCSVKQYLDEFKKSERKRTGLLNRDEGQLLRNWEAKNSIIVTWQILFEHIHRTRPSAADLLSLMSFFDRQGIPEVLLRSQIEQGDTQRGQEEPEDDELDSDEQDSLSQSSAGEDGFEDDVIALRNFRFISVDTTGTTFEIHGLVQLATRTWLAANGRLERWKQQFISNLCAKFPSRECENWAACQALFAHAKLAAGQQPEGKLSLAKWATLLYRAAWYAWRKGNAGDAVMLAVKSMKARKKLLGQDHEDTLSSMEMVGLAYDIDGKWEAAEELQVEALEMRKAKLGADHPHTLTSMGNLASTYMYQGRWDAAEGLQVKVLETCKMKLGADHLSTLTSMNNLAFTWKSQGRDAEAVSLIRDCALLCQQVLTTNHPALVSCLTTLARWEAEPSAAGLVSRLEEV